MTKEQKYRRNLFFKIFGMSVWLFSTVFCFLLGVDFGIVFPIIGAVSLAALVGVVGSSK